MVKRIAQVLAVLGVMLLVGCIGPYSINPEYEPIPVERIYKLSFLDEANNKKPARINFYRNNSLLWYLCGSVVFVDGVKAFTIRPMEIVTIEASPGTYLLTVKGEVTAINCAETPIWASDEMILREGDEREYSFNPRFVRVK